MVYVLKKYGIKFEKFIHYGIQGRLCSNQRFKEKNPKCNDTRTAKLRTAKRGNMNNFFRSLFNKFGMKRHRSRHVSDEIYFEKGFLTLGKLFSFRDFFVI